MPETKPWPLDFDTLSTGDRVTVEAIEKFCGKPRTEPAYRTRGQLQIVELIRRRRPDLDAYVRCQGYDVVVMEPVEASQHRESQSEQALGKFARSHRRNLSIDVTTLGPEELDRHEKAIYRHGRYASALGTVRKELTLTAARASKPALGDAG